MSGTIPLSTSVSSWYVTGRTEKVAGMGIEHASLWMLHVNRRDGRPPHEHDPDARSCRRMEATTRTRYHSADSATPLIPLNASAVESQFKFIHSSHGHADTQFLLSAELASSDATERHTVTRSTP
jgi:hypothetical protein